MSPKDTSANLRLQDNGNQEASEKSRPAKRARVAVACTRCKTRKQKCDGERPKCSNCRSVSASCEYVPSEKSIPYGKYEYIKSLESKVAELQTLLMGATSLTGLYGSQQQDGHDSVPSGIPQPGTTNSEQRVQDLLLPNHRTQSIFNNSGDDWCLTDGKQDIHHREPIQAASLELLPHSFPQDAPEKSQNGRVGQIFGALMKGKEAPIESIKDPNHVLSPTSPGMSSEYGKSDNESARFEIARINQAVAEKLLRGYNKHITTRWPILHSSQFKDLHARRRSLDGDFEVSTLSLVYAIGGRFLETTGEVGNFFPERHYQTAMQSIDRILQTHNIHAVQTLLLHAVYCLRAPRRPGSWTHTGLAIRICIELGFHRKSTKVNHSQLYDEMRRRVFWSAYCLDRQVSIILSRPFAIPDSDIDIELPLDVNESATEEELDMYLRGAITPGLCTSMSCFIHITRLRCIESKIQQSVYAVARPSSMPDSIIDRFLEDLVEWKACIPPDYHPNSDQETHDRYDYYLVYYYKCLLYLLRPFVSRQNVDTRILLKCAEACGGVCRTYQKLHGQTPVGFSLMALYSIFLSGLTLIYCIWIDPISVFSIRANNDLNACSIVLYVIAERWPGARKYRDVFETIKQCMMDFIADGDQLPRKPLIGIDAALRATLEDVQNLHPEGREDFGRMIGDMLAESAALDSIADVERGVLFQNPESRRDRKVSRRLNSQQASKNAHGSYEGGNVWAEGEVLHGSLDLFEGFDMEDCLFSPNFFGGPLT